jgi:hypothetical protein
LSSTIAGALLGRISGRDHRSGTLSCKPFTGGEPLANPLHRADRPEALVIFWVYFF